MAKSFAETNPLDPELVCPYAFNQQLREEAPVYHCPQTGVYFISSYDLVVEVTKNEKRFSNDFNDSSRRYQAARSGDGSHHEKGLSA